MERTHNASQDFARTPRRRRPKRRPPLRPWMRRGLLVLLIGMMLALSVGLVAKAVKPYREARQQGRQLSGNRAKLEAVQTQNAVLRQRIAYLQTADGQRDEARKAGYVRPGEIPFVVEGADLSDALAAPSASSPAPRSWWQRLRGRH